MRKKILSIKELRTICQTPESSLHDSPICAILFRKISIYITRLLLYTPISANQVTIAMFIAGIACGTFFILGSQGYLIAGFVCFFLMAVLDTVDGEIARARGQGSLRGVYLDRLSHIVTYPYILIGAGIGIYNVTGDMLALLFGLLAGFFWSVSNQTKVEKQLILNKATGGVKRNPKKGLITWPDSIKRIVALFYPTGVDIMLVGFFFAAILDQMFIVLVWFGVAIPLTWLWEVLSDFKRHFL